MPKSRPPYPPEFRQRMIELVRSGKTPKELAREFEPTSQSIRNWLAQAGIEEGVASKSNQQVKADERYELERLRRENRVLREEREILKKAAAWFAQETGVPFTRRSSS